MMMNYQDAGFYGGGVYPVEAAAPAQTIRRLNTVARIRDRIVLSRADALFQCVFCNQPVEPMETINLMTLDTPLTEKSPFGVEVWHKSCRDQWESQTQSREAADRVQLPHEIVARENQSGRDAVAYIMESVPSAVAVTKSYESCESLVVKYAAADACLPDGRTGLCSWVLSMPEAAAAVVPVQSSVINRATMPGVFRARMVMTVAVDGKLGTTRLDDQIAKEVRSTMDSSLDSSLRNSLRTSGKEKLDVVGDFCEVALFRHSHMDPNEPSRSYFKYVVEVGIPAKKLETTVDLFNRMFLDPDGDVQRDNDKLMWVEAFKREADVTTNHEVVLRDGTVAPLGSNGSRQRTNRKTWASKWMERRKLLRELLDQLYNSINGRISKYGSVSKTEPTFINSWTDTTVEVAQDNESRKWEYLVNAQKISNYRGSKEADLIYVVSDDMNTLLCFRNDSAMARDETYSYLPNVCTTDTSILLREMPVRGFVQVTDKGEKLVYRSPEAGGKRK